MSSFELRHATLDDAPEVTALIRALDTALQVTPELEVADLVAEWQRADLERETWLLVEDGRVAGYGGLTKHLVADGYVHPDFWGRGAGARLVELLEEGAVAHAASSLQNAVLEADERAQELLRSRGYRDIRHYRRMTIVLRGPPRAPDWAGLRAAPFEREHARAFHAALEQGFAQEWDHVPETFEAWSDRRLEAEPASPELWRVVWDGNEIAAGTVCDARSNGMGWIGAVFVLERWRRRGLGLALLHDAFGKFWERGERLVGLGVDAENPTGATRLYERAGMSVAWGAAIFEKRL